MAKVSSYLIIALIVSALTVAMSSRLAYGADKAETKIRISIMSLTPYGFFDEQKNPKGDLFEIAQAFLIEGDFKGEVRIEPVKRLNHSIFAKQTSDCAIIGNVPFVLEKYTLIEPIGYDLEFGLLPRKGVVIKRYADIFDLRLGVPLGVSIGRPFDDDDSLNKISTRDYQTGMLMLSRDRLDALAGVIGSLKFSGKMNNVSEDAYDTPFITSELSFWFVCRPGFANAALEASIRRAVTTLRESGVVKRIVDRYRR